MIKQGLALDYNTLLFLNCFKLKKPSILCDISYAITQIVGKKEIKGLKKQNQKFLSHGLEKRLDPISYDIPNSPRNA